jgi:hypothetical protein
MHYPIGKSESERQLRGREPVAAHPDRTSAGRRPVRLGREPSGHHPRLLLLGIHPIADAWWNDGRISIGQVGPQRIGAAQCVRLVAYAHGRRDPLRSLHRHEDHPGHRRGELPSFLASSQISLSTHFTPLIATRK